jgi:murein DD-endopeptidase
MLRRMRMILFGVVATLLLMAHGSTSKATQPRPRLVQSVDLQVRMTPMPVTVAGRTCLAYELHITNFRPFEVVLTRAQVLDDVRGASLADLQDATLSANLGHPGAGKKLTDNRAIAPGMHAVLYVWLRLNTAEPTPARLRHRVDLDLMRPDGAEHVVIEGAAIEVSRRKPAALGAPLRGGPWVALYDPAMAGGHRTSIYTLDGRARIPARFAIDWVRLDRDASHARGDASLIANWHGYGQEVLSVANATVAEAFDDMPEQPALTDEHEALRLEQASGNSVTLDLGNGRYAFYEHLKHGSIRVNAGERVKRGQVIGLLGNSGSSSSGPHLHFHVADASADLASEGLPYVFDSFEVVGEFDAVDTFMRSETWNAASPVARGQREMELPAANTVIVFH